MTITREESYLINEDNLKSLNAVEKNYKLNLWHIRSVFIFAVVLIFIGIALSIKSILFLWFTDHSPNIFIGNIVLINNESRMILSLLGFFLIIVGLIILLAYKSTFKEIQTYSYSIERINTIRTSFKLIASMPEENGFLKYKVDTTNRTIEVLMDIIKNM